MPTDTYLFGLQSEIEEGYIKQELRREKQEGVRRKVEHPPLEMYHLRSFSNLSTHRQDKPSFSLGLLAWSWRGRRKVNLHSTCGPLRRIYRPRKIGESRSEAAVKDLRHKSILFRMLQNPIEEFFFWGCSTLFLDQPHNRSILHPCIYMTSHKI